MNIFLAMMIGLVLSMHGGFIGRKLWSVDSRIGMVWMSEREYVVSLRLFGALILMVGLIGAF
jgi:hypothetical protein